jgi:hypothetical protein
VVAAENSWGRIAEQIGGSHVKVTSIINNPDTDPHDYEPTAADARTVATSVRDRERHWLRLLGVPARGFQPLAAALGPDRRGPRRDQGRRQTPPLVLPDRRPQGDRAGQRHPTRAFALFTVLAVAEMWGGLAVSYEVPKMPPSFAIVALAATEIAFAFVLGPRRRRGLRLSQA